MTAAASRTETAALVALLRARPGGMSWSEITAAVIERGSAVDLWESVVPATLVDLVGEDPRDNAGADVARWAESGMRLVTILDPDYPARLRGVHEAPPILFTRGDLRPDDVGVSVVGSRRASERGVSIAAAIATQLSTQGISVVSGLAAGIDAAERDRLQRLLVDRAGGYLRNVIRIHG